MPKSQKGETHSRAVLTDARVREARQTFVRYDREFGNAALAKKCGVSPAAMHNAIHKITWGHVD